MGSWGTPWRHGVRGIRTDRLPEMSRHQFGAYSIVMDTTLDHLCTLFTNEDPLWLPGVPTRQTSSSGKPKSPRIQVVLPEDLCERLTWLAEQESRTVSNMARVLIQQGVQRHEQAKPTSKAAVSEALASPQERFRSALEAQQPRRLRGAPRRLRLQRPR